MRFSEGPYRRGPETRSLEYKFRKILIHRNSSFSIVANKSQFVLGEGGKVRAQNRGHSSTEFEGKEKAR